MPTMFTEGQPDNYTERKRVRQRFGHLLTNGIGFLPIQWAILAVGSIVAYLPISLLFGRGLLSILASLALWRQIILRWEKKDLSHKTHENYLRTQITRRTHAHRIVGGRRQYESRPQRLNGQVHYRVEGDSDDTSQYAA